MWPVFGTDYRTAKFGDDVAHFTVAEARVLKVLSRNAGRTLTRDQILDAVSDVGSDKSDRSVDFLINRVRRKLGDSPRDPRFIGTRYGGGYVWLGPPPVVMDVQKIVEAEAVIGPVRGLDLLGTASGAGEAFAGYLAKALEAEIERSVPVEPDFDPTKQPSDGPARFNLEISFFRVAERPECVVTCWSRISGGVFFVERMTLIREGAPYPSLRREADRLIPLILLARWRCEMGYKISSEPLAVAMQNASFNEKSTAKAWLENNVHLSKMRADHPDDPEIAVSYAHHLHSRVIIHGRDLFQTGADACRSIDTEIEQLVQGALPGCQDKPELLMIAAKLLYYVDRSYKSLALELAQRAYSQSTTIASSLAIFGQLRAFTGDTDGALVLLRQAEALAMPKSRFRHYVQVFICQALIAADDRAALEPVRAQVYNFHPLARLLYELVMTDAEQPSLRAKGAMLTMSRSRACGVLRFLHHIHSRLFDDPEHRVNALRTPIALFVRRFGHTVVPAELVASAPSLFERSSDKT